MSTKAGAALAAAKRVNAESLAPFEYTAAEAYLVKAREEAGYSQYQPSIEFARRAEALANRARAMAVAASTPGPEKPASPDELGVVPAALVGGAAPAVDTTAAPAAAPAPAPAAAPPRRSRPATDDEQPRKQ